MTHGDQVGLIERAWAVAACAITMIRVCACCTTLAWLVDVLAPCGCALAHRVPG